MEGLNEELSMEYAFVRRQWPGASAEEVAERITARLTAEQRLALAGDALVWHDEPGSRRELAVLAVRNFVLAIETGPEDDPQDAAP